MAQRRLVLAVAALLTVAALGFVATGLEGAASGGSGVESSGASGSGGQPSGTSGSETVATGLVVILLALAVGSIAYATYQESIPRWLAVVILASVVVLLALVAVGNLLDPAGPGEATPDVTPAPDTPDQPSNPTPSADSGGEPGPLSTTTVLLLLGALLAGGVLAVTRFSRGVPEESEEEVDDESAAVAEAAGRAADELEETTLSNAVFRAWREMTDALDVESPETTTPAEFEESAVEAGLAREDVATLTDLFREIRYGDAPATEAREERARTALRRIEETYADATEAKADDTGGDEQ
jgi:hypothetical protein